MADIARHAGLGHKPGRLPYAQRCHEPSLGMLHNLSHQVASENLAVLFAKRTSEIARKDDVATQSAIRPDKVQAIMNTF